MHHFRFVSLTLTTALLAGCAFTPNQPTLVLDTTLTSENYATCLLPKLQREAYTVSLSQTQRHYRIVVASPVAADNVIEAYDHAAGGKIFIYQRSLLAHGFIEAARECA